MGKIYVFAVPCVEERGIDQSGADHKGIEFFNGDCVGYAVAEDGEGLASHLSSSIGWFRHDMGISGSWKRDTYAKKYPEGFELVEIDYRSMDPGFRAAMDANKALAQSENRT